MTLCYELLIHSVIFVQPLAEKSDFKISDIISISGLLAVYWRELMGGADG